MHKRYAITGLRVLQALKPIGALELWLEVGADHERSLPGNPGSLFDHHDDPENEPCSNFVRHQGTQGTTLSVVGSSAHLHGDI